MTITITKLRLALGVLVVALLVPATALATHVFDDVAHDRFYAEPVEWAAANGITTGKSPTIFDPEGAVTRGESVTFLRRYDENVVLPRLEAFVGNLEAALPFAVSAAGDQLVSLNTDDAVIRTLDLDAPVAGTATVTASGYFAFEAFGEDIARCSITNGALVIDETQLIIATAPLDATGLFPTVYQQFSSTVVYPVPAGTSTFNLVCEQLSGDVSVGDTILVAQFAPDR